jgi:Na+(H+)/acetate symporter ActP
MRRGVLVGLIVIGMVLLVAFVFKSGVRAVAWVSVLKDFLMVFAAVCIGIGIPVVHFGGIGPMFSALDQAHPAHLLMPGSTPPPSISVALPSCVAAFGTLSMMGYLPGRRLSQVDVSRFVQVKLGDLAVHERSPERWSTSLVQSIHPTNILATSVLADAMSRQTLGFGEQGTSP